MQKNTRDQMVDKIRNLSLGDRINSLKTKMVDESRYLSLEQALIVTECYKLNEEKPVSIKRAMSLASALEKMAIQIDPEELIVGNRTAGVRSGVVSPDAGISWINREIEHLHDRPQDRFKVRPADVAKFREIILPYWKGKSLEDVIYNTIGDEVSAIGKVAKINQKDHAQGHICPNTEKWLALGPSGILSQAENAAENASPDKKDFYSAVDIVLNGAIHFIIRYADKADSMADIESNVDFKINLREIAKVCRKIAIQPAETFREALQSLWFLYVILQMESNASSFSPGRADQYLYPYWKHEIDKGTLDFESSLELIEALWLKFNQIVYLRNSGSAKYFAGFPIGFNIALGGQNLDGTDASNELSFLFLKAQDLIGLPQPNLSARLFVGSPQDLVNECSRVIGKGSGMPQILNDDSIIPALMNQGIKKQDAVNYAVVGCVELSTHGNNLGWSDAAMFNLNKALELTMNHGKCLLSHDTIGPDFGGLDTYTSFDELENAFQRQLDHFIDRMMVMCDRVDRFHAEILPSAFLSSVIDDCIENGKDVTAGGAFYNLSGIQAIQVANLADSLATLKKMVFDDKSVTGSALLKALQENWAEDEILRQRILNKVPKYGNDEAWVDNLGANWVRYFAKRMGEFTNARGGRYHTGLYTVSAHVPMGQNVGASPDGRKAMDPLADGGMSAMYGRDVKGPTALLHSVSRIPSECGSNGTLLNMKFLPEFFQTREGIQKFSSFLRTFLQLHINHIQFNVLRKEDLIAARKNPEMYKGLTVRVAGYTAYFTELAGDLQEEIIARTSYSGT